MRRRDDDARPLLNRAQRRAIQKLMKHVEKTLDADKAFFLRRLDRKHRLRLSARAEVEQMRIADGMPPPAPGWKAYTVVRCINPAGVRMRAFFSTPDELETDISEAAAAALYAEFVTARTQQIEDVAREVLEKYYDEHGNKR